MYNIYFSTCHSQVQRDFNENLREIKQTFEQILEGEKHIDVAKNQLAVCEHREAKLKKELKKPCQPRLLLKLFLSVPTQPVLHMIHDIQRIFNILRYLEKEVSGLCSKQKRKWMIVIML